jgi:hypothetical protein
MSEKVATMIPGLVLDFGERAKHKPFGQIFCFEKHISRSKFQSPEILNAFSRSKLCVINTQSPCFGAEDNELKHPKLFRNLILFGTITCREDQNHAWR